MKHRRFTLIELLVVIAVIAILTSMLLPALQKVRRTTRRVACMNNLRQIVLSTINYASENDGEFPSHKDNSTSWPWGFSDWGLEKTRFYAEYLSVKDSYFCPQDLANDWRSEGAKCYPHFPSNEPSAWRVNISYNYFYGRDAWNPNSPNKRHGFIKLQNVTDASKSTILADVMRFGAAPNYQIISNWNHRVTITLYGAGGNMGYADGHVAWMDGPDELLSHRQKMKSNDNKSYAAEQPGD